MISRVTGKLIAVNETSAEVDVSGIGYAMLITPSACASMRSMIGEVVTLYCVYYIEGSGIGGNMTPRLVGFLDPEEREFFEMLKTVKGMGARKALRAMTVPFRKISRAIEDGDTATLRRLPEVGARTADKIVAELHGKMQRFALGEPSQLRETEEMPAFKSDAVAVLTNTGMSRAEALTKVDHALRRAPEIETTEELLSEAFRQQK